jgi:hypothetical protein
VRVEEVTRLRLAEHVRHEPLGHVPVKVAPTLWHNQRLPGAPGALGSLAQLRSMRMGQRI